MRTEELLLNEEGYSKIACIDEVGRGCLAGDVVSAAVIMPIDSVIEGIKDSKKLSEKKRELLYERIKEEALAIGIGRVSPKKIDEINIRQATLLAMKIAVTNMKDKDGNIIRPDFILIDAERLDLGIPEKSLVKGDEICYGISAASIVAKVYRDNLCKNEWENEYPEYNFKKHKGYGTKEHRENILKYGPCKIHRQSFLKKIIK
ncbi:MAG: ribonuclease HII [Andreesenia angusta]|nr:ribonuclease HII [Andreesenia angusta]